MINQKTDINYILLILLHALLGFVIFLIKPIAFAYSFLIITLGCYFIIKNKNRNNEVLLWSAYVVGAEVFLRMTKGYIGYEYGKYTLIVFMLLGIFIDGISKRSRVYGFFILFLLPSLFIGIGTIDVEKSVWKGIMFNLLGPMTLAISSIYTVDKKVTLLDIEKMTRWMLYSLIPMLVYLFLYTPTVREVVTGTESNGATSGGFGPNQVSTVLGLGMFVSFVRYLFFSKTYTSKIISIVLLALFSFRGLVTFSRGGFITGVVMIVVLALLVFFNTNNNGKYKIITVAGFVALFGTFVLTYTIQQTSGLIVNRYTGKDALGREKASKFSGREELAATELELFLSNPFLGVGVGKNEEYRLELTGTVGASHNEITRMLAEHGLFGIIDLTILIFTPFLLYINNRQHIFLLSFFIFWLFTINHAAMRIAAPAFMYALTLLKVIIVEEPVIHRKQTIK